MPGVVSHMHVIIWKSHKMVCVCPTTLISTEQHKPEQNCINYLLWEDVVHRRQWCLGLIQPDTSKRRIHPHLTSHC